MRLQKRGLIIWTSAFFDVFVLDRVLKYLAMRGEHAALIGDSVIFRLFENRGIAFSIDLSGPIVWILTVGILGWAALLATRDVRARRYDRLPAYGFFLFGACSNLFDRVVYGYTVDYLIFFGRSAVNLADGMILFGALWLVRGERRA